MDAAQRGLIVQYGCTLYSTLLNKDICSTCTVCTVGCSSKWINVSENIGMHRRIYIYTVAQEGGCTSSLL